MDVTPQELRDIDIRESFRGYHRDEVDELLERAAGTIEHLEHQIRILQERLASGPAPQRGAQPAPQPVQQAPAPAPAPVPTPIPVPDSDVIQRTLILAQKAADEAVAEAQAKAAQLTSESEAKAAALVTEAETTARRIAESERRRIEAEIAQLGSTRDALVEDVDALERFSAEYRDRIRLAIEAELLHLSAASASDEAPPPRPALQTEGMTFASGAAAAAPAPAPTAQAAAPQPVFGSEPESTMSVEAVAAESTGGVDLAESSGVVDLAAAEAQEPERLGASAPGAGSQEPERLGASAPGSEAPAWNAAGDADAAWSPEPAGGWGGDDDFGGLGSAPDEYAADSLDDDAFFASLRDAVRDDEPLGPREEGYYDEDAEGGKKLFRRRR
jgi:DivIVA domain-containing protein